MSNETEKKVTTGLEQASNRKEAEYDLVSALLEAAEYKEDENSVTEVEIKRAGKYLFSVHIHPISEPDLRHANKKATIYMPNPENKKLPPIEKDKDMAKFNSWLIYLATTEADQAALWGNPQVIQKFGLAQPVDTIDVLLTIGEKRKLADLVLEISGMEDDEGVTVTKEEYAKN